MQEQQKFRYFINGSEVSTRKDYLNATMSGEYFTVIDEDKVNSVSLSTFFAENKDNNKLIKREVNDFLKFTMLDKELDNTKGHSTRLKANTPMGHRLIEEELEKQENLPKHQPVDVTELLNKWVGNLEGINRPPYKTFHENKEKINQFFRQPTQEEIIEILKKSIEIESGGKLKKEHEEILDNLAMGQITDKGVKETEGKLDYSEINLGILDLMAQRIAKNKHKYPKGNSLKPIDIKELEQALFRHLKKMIQPIENDPETYEDHLSAILCNSSFILTQLNLHNSK